MMSELVGWGLWVEMVSICNHQGIIEEVISFLFCFMIEKALCVIC